MTKLLWIVLMLAACDVGAEDVMTTAKNDLAKGADPCQDPAIRKKVTVKADPDNPHRFVGSNGDDVIFGTNGNDIIFGNGGDDLILRARRRRLHRRRRRQRPDLRRRRR